jgi:hypothetical protein
MVRRRLALVIGNNYPNSGKELKFAVADALKMKDVLTNKDICGFKVDLLIDKTSNEAFTKLDELLTDAHQDDLILIYFSGHGKKDPNNDKLYLLFKNTNEKLLNSSAISFDSINNCLKSPSALKASIVIVLDCCYSGAAGIRGADLDVMEALEKPSGPGTVILISTGSTGSSNAKEEEKLGHGVFTYYLIEGLEKGYADQDHNGYISIDDLYEYAYYNTKENSSQSPARKGSVEGNIFIGINPKIIKERKHKYELKQATLIKNLGPQLPSIILIESLTILKKYYTTPYPLGQADATIFGYLESLLQSDLLPEKYSDAIQNYIDVVQHLKGISIKDRQKKWKEEKAEQKQEDGLERETRDKEEQEILRKQRDEELQRQREEEERKREKEFLEKQQLEEQERKRKEEEKARKKAEEKAIKEKEEQERLRQQEDAEQKQREEDRKREEKEGANRRKSEKEKQEEIHKRMEEIQRLVSKNSGERLVELDAELSVALPSKLPSKIDEIVEEQFGKLPEGLVKFIFNKKMKVDVSEKVEAYIAKNACQINEKIEQYYLSREDKVSSLSRKVKITSRMRISLEGANFDIKATTPQVQQILNNEATTWRWTVKPLKSGIQKLFLSVDIIIKFPQDTDRERHITMLEEEIKVKVNPMYILECNWKWFLGTIITIILAILFKG